ncbi:MAG: SH3 domain-containing protein [Firmicutes bacterium]|nr:SH3 domain-containing protein [Bacillota bacterium]
MTGAASGHAGRFFAKSAKRTFFVCLFMMLLLLTSAFFAPSADAAEGSVSSGTTGTVATEALNVRAGAGTLNEAIGMVYMGETVTILGSEKDYTGTVWYKISYQGGTGYVSSDYITIRSDHEYTYDAAFEQELTRQGFPESYKPYLRQLHADYPNWVFEACQTGLTWSEVLEAESKPGRNLIPGTSPSSWKSMDAGAFNFATGTYIQYDSGNWVTASRTLTAYYMDPRNFLNSSGIFQFLSHSYDGRTQTSAGLSGVLNGTFLSGAFPEDGYDTYNQVLMEIGEKTGVNPYVLASMILVEQGSTGIGKSISGTVSGYEGFYNHFNVGAYAAGGMDAVTHGLWYAAQTGSYCRPWNSVYKSIYGGAMYYSQNYVMDHQNTLYLKKFNVMNGSASVGIGQYMTNVQGAESEAAALRKGYTKVMDTAMTFLIPVYEAMPSSACPKPQSTAGNNNYLSSLSVSAGMLSPAFSGQQTSYTVQVPDGVTSVTVSAKASDAGASVSGTGTVSLSSGSRTVKITVTAPDGEKRTYSIAFTVKGQSLQDPSGSIAAGVQATTIRLSSALTEQNDISLSWVKSAGYKVDSWQVFRSTARYSGFGTKPVYTTASGTETSWTDSGLETGSTYYYKVRGVRTLDGKKVYTQWSTKSWRTIKEKTEPVEEEPASPENPGTADDPDSPGGGGAQTEGIRLGIQNTAIEASSCLTETGKIRLDWSKSPGYRVDYYEIFRSSERYSGFGSRPYFTTSGGSVTWYINSKGLQAGTTYYYKIRGVRIVEGEKVCTQWSNKTWRTVKG